MKSCRINVLVSLMLVVFSGCSLAPTSSSDSNSTDTVQVQSSGSLLTETRQIFTVTPLSSSRWLILGGHLENDPAGKVSSSADILEVLADGNFRIQKFPAVMKRPRWGHRATRLNNEDILVCGGTDATECEKLSASTNKFLEAGKLSHARSAAAQILLPSGRVLIAGGYNKGEASLGRILNSAEVYDPNSNSMTSFLKMNAHRAGHVLVLWNNNAYVIGGTEGAAATIEKFEESTQKFSETDMKLPYAVKDFQIHQKNNVVYLFGGSDGEGNSIAKIIKIDLKSEQVEEMPASLLEAREDLSLCPSVDGNHVLTFGGEVKGLGKEGTHSGQVELVSFSPFSVDHARAEIYRDDAQTVLLPNGTCLVIGGTSANETVDRSVLRIKF